MARQKISSTKHSTLYKEDDGNFSILVKDVRLSYPHLDKPYKGDNGGEGGPKFSGVFLSPSERKEVIQTCVKVIDHLLKEKNKGAKLPSDRKFIRNGDDSGKEGYDGHYSINASETETRPPILRDEANKNVSPEKALRKFYAGCRVNVFVKPWFQDNKFGKRVNASLLMVQFVGDDTPLGSERISEEDADEIFEGVEGSDASGFDDDDTDGL